MFGNFERRQKTGPSNEALRPGKTDEAALELLREKVDAVIEQDGASFGALTEADIDMVVNTLAVMQEKTGEPYTVQSLTDFDEGLPEEIGATIIERISARGGAPTIVTDSQGVVHRAENTADAKHFVEEQRSQES